MTVTVSPEIADALKRDARRRGCSVSESLRGILGDHFHLTLAPGTEREIGFAKLGASGLPGVAGQTDEFLQENWVDAIDSDR